MPNYIKHRLYIKADKETKEKVMNACVNRTDEKPYFDFNMIIPEPSDLELEGNFEAEQCIKYYIKQRTEPNWNLNGIPFSDYGMPAELHEQNKPIAKQMWDNYRKYGYMYWFDWRLANWGTKWHACEHEIGEDRISFETANNDARRVLVRLSAMFPEVEFYMEYANEDKGRDCGKITFLGGNITMLEEYNYRTDGEQALRYALSVWEYDYDEWKKEHEEE